MLSNPKDTALAEALSEAVREAFASMTNDQIFNAFFGPDDSKEMKKAA